MGNENGDPTDEESTRDQGSAGPTSTARVAARGLYAAAGGNPEIFDDVWDDMLGEVDGRQIDGAIASGMYFGQSLAEQRRSLRDTAEMQGEGDDPLVQVRELEQDGEFAGLRVLCTDPEAEVFMSDNRLLVRGDDFERAEPVLFDHGGIEKMDTEGVAEYVVHPAAADEDEDEEGG